MSKSRKPSKPKKNRGNVLKNKRRIDNNTAILNRLKEKCSN